MNVSTNNIIETVIRTSKRQKLNVLYNDTVSSPVSAFLCNSDNLNFIRANKLQIETLNIGFSAYFCSDYLEISKSHSNIINAMHVKNIIPFVDPPFRALKKEDFLILNQNLSSSKKICFNDFIHKIWSQHFEIDNIKPGVPDFEFNDSKDRKSIIVISSSNKKQAKTMHEQIAKVVDDVGLILSFSKISLEEAMATLSQYKTAIVLDNSISCFMAMSAGCGVVCPIPFYEEVLTYKNSKELNEAISSSDQLFDSGETLSLAKKMKEDNSFKNFDRELYNHIINITKEPFLL